MSPRTIPRRSDRRDASAPPPAAQDASRTNVARRSPTRTDAAKVTSPEVPDRHATARTKHWSPPPASGPQVTSRTSRARCRHRSGERRRSVLRRTGLVDHRDALVVHAASLCRPSTHPGHRPRRRDQPGPQERGRVRGTRDRGVRMVVTPLRAGRREPGRTVQRQERGRHQPDHRPRHYPHAAPRTRPGSLPPAVTDLTPAHALPGGRPRLSRSAPGPASPAPRPATPR